MKKITLTLFSLFLLQTIYAQTNIKISGIVKDTANMTVIGASVKLATAKDTLFATTNPDGVFIFSNIKSSEFSITITALGFQTIKKRYLFEPTSTRETLNPIILKADSKMLNEVVVNGTPDVTVKEDTLQYRADGYKLRENALAEDLLKKLPGIEVDKDGNVTAQGTAIKKIRINGKDFFGGDVKTATQQLPADVIKNVQVIDDYGDQAGITGVKDGDPDKILNFTIREDKNKGYLARGIVGGGNEDRYQASLFAASFDNGQQLALLANFNNTNANIFSLTSGGSSGGSGGGRGGRPSFSGGESADGLTGVNSIGFNYRDEWSKKVTAYGSYSFANKDNNTTSNFIEKTVTANNTINNISDVISNSGNTNHRFNFNIEYKIDSLNYLKVTPNVSFGNSDGVSNTNFTISNLNSTSIGTSSNQTNATNPNFGAEVLYNHRFGAKARNLSFNGDFSSSSNHQDQNYEYSNTQTGQLDKYQNQLINGDNKNDNVNLKLSYTEPLTKTKNLEFNYAYGFSRADNNRTVKNTDTEGQTPVLDTDQSNYYVFDYITNKFGVNYRVDEKKYNYRIGFSAQPAVLKGSGTGHRTVTNFFPSARFSYKFSKTREFRVYYDGKSNQPGYAQLQPITDKSNAQAYVKGNEFLNPEFTNRLSIRYNSFDFASGNVLFTNLSYENTKDKIVTNVINYPIAGDSTVLRQNEYLNADGYYNINAFYAFSKPFKEKKYVIRTRGSAIYNNNISFLDGKKNTGKNLILSQRLDLQINPVTWLELNPAGTYTYNKNNNSLNTRANAEVNSISYSFDSKIYFLKTWIWGTTTEKTYNSGYNSIGKNPLIINSYLEKQFLKGKKASFKLQAFDILDQSTSLSYVVNGPTSTLSQSNRLSRYFMLSFAFNISKFAGNSSSNMPEMGGGERRYRRDE